MPKNQHKPIARVTVDYYLSHEVGQDGFAHLLTKLSSYLSHEVGQTVFAHLLVFVSTTTNTTQQIEQQYGTKCDTSV